MENFERDEIINYLRHFDRTFNTKFEFSFNTDELILFFRGLKNTIDEIIPIDEYIEKLSKKNELIEKLDLNEEQMKIFNKYCDCEYETSEIYRKEIVILMYIFMKCF